MDTECPYASHESDEPPESESHDAQSPVCCVPDASKEDLLQSPWGPIAPRVEVDGRHFVYGIDSE